jgi:hypothetical protein
MVIYEDKDQVGGDGAARSSSMRGGRYYHFCAQIDDVAEKVRKSEKK